MEQLICKISRETDPVLATLVEGFRDYKSDALVRAKKIMRTMEAEQTELNHTHEDFWHAVEKHLRQTGLMPLNYDDDKHALQYSVKDNALYMVPATKSLDPFERLKRSLGIEDERPACAIVPLPERDTVH